MRDAALDPQEELGIPASSLPRHIAIIMDGNGRWARQRNLPRIKGHQAGAGVVRDVVTRCARLELDALTLYSFSAENWKRPRMEVDFLMELYARYLVAERQEILDNNIRFMQIGRREGLPDHVLEQLEETARSSRGNSGLKLVLALNYGSRLEIVDAVRRLAGDVQAGRLRPRDITEQTISAALDTAGLPDPDLLIRTAGESRISNFLLWQISYAEFYVEPCFWPDFTTAHLDRAIQEYARRERRFGGLAAGPSDS
jgi:undecaprenyl diphosphate synthase